MAPISSSLNRDRPSDSKGPCVQVLRSEQVHFRRECVATRVRVRRNVPLNPIPNTRPEESQRAQAAWGRETQACRPHRNSGKMDPLRGSVNPLGSHSHCSRTECTLPRAPWRLQILPRSKVRAQHENVCPDPRWGSFPNSKSNSLSAPLPTGEAHTPGLEDTSPGWRVQPAHLLRAGAPTSAIGP